MDNTKIDKCLYQNENLREGKFRVKYRPMDIYAIRKKRLRLLIDARFDGEYAKLAEFLGKQPSQISRLFSDKKSGRTIGSALAREVEEKLSLPVGWLDRVEAVTGGPDPELLARCLLTIRQAAAELNEHLTDEEHSHLSAMLYTEVVSEEASGEALDLLLRKLAKLFVRQHGSD